MADGGDDARDRTEADPEFNVELFSQWLSAAGLPPLTTWQAAVLAQMPTAKEPDHG